MSMGESCTGWRDIHVAVGLYAFGGCHMPGPTDEATVQRLYIEPRQTIHRRLNVDLDVSEITASLVFSQRVAAVVLNKAIS